MTTSTSRPLTVGAVSDALATIAPTRHAADWDNVGLLVGARDWAAARVMLTIDLTDAVLAEAVDAGVSMIVAYHPPLFAPFRRLTDEDPKQRLVLGAVRAGIAIHSPHTALDAAPGGVNDWLADGLGAGDRRALTPATALPTTEACKIITFCPADAVDRIRDGLSTAGAGRIEAYTQCSFATAGTGTFRGDEGTHPTVGQRGRLERLDEIRLEMVCSRESLPLALVMLREFHPYETPPVEVHALQARPLRQVGEGRRLVLDRPVASSTLARRVRETLGVGRVEIAAPPGRARRIGVVGLCVGAGGSMVATAVAQGCDAFITGEMRHHDVLDAIARGCTVILAGHTNTERGYLKVLQRRLGEALPDLECTVSRKDVDPLRSA